MAAAAQEPGRWQFVPIAGDDTVMSIDARTLQLEGGIAAVWVQYVSKPGMGHYIGGRQVAKTLQREEFHCRNRQVGVLSYQVCGQR